MLWYMQVLIYAICIISGTQRLPTAQMNKTLSSLELFKKSNKTIMPDASDISDSLVVGEEENRTCDTHKSKDKVLQEKHACMSSDFVNTSSAFTPYQELLRNVENGSKINFIIGNTSGNVRRPRNIALAASPSETKDLSLNLSQEARVSRSTPCANCNTTPETEDYNEYEEQSLEIRSFRKESNNEVGREEKERQIDQKLTYTCRGRCGKALVYPCSCSAICVLYDSCCENMSLDCPYVIEDGRQQFGALLASKLVCRRVYQISSCVVNTFNLPKGVGEPQPIDFGEKVDSIFDEFGDMRFKHLSEKEIKRAVVSAPVTEAVSGITFSNKSIYDCYRTSETSAKILNWGLKLRMTYTSPLSLMELGKVDSQDPYEPLFDTDILSPHLCIENAIQSCPGDPRCSEFLGYVISTRLRKYYRNRYCAYCYEDRHDRLQLVNTYRTQISFKFHTVVSLTAPENYHVHLEFSDIFPPWSQAQCSTTDSVGREVEGTALEGEKNTGGLDKLVCTVACGHPRFTIKSDGRCKARHRELIGFTDDYDNYEKKRSMLSQCHWALPQVAKFVSCSLQISLQNEAMMYAEFESNSISVHLDERTNKTLYVVELLIDTPRRLTDILGDYEDTIYSLHKVALTLHALQILKHTEDVCTSLDGDHYNNAGFSMQDPTTFTILRTQTYYDSASLKRLGNYTILMKEFRGPVMNTKPAITFCASSLSMNLESELQLWCVEDGLHQNDTEQIAEMLSSPCMDHLRRKDSSGLSSGFHHRYSYSFYMGFSIGVLLRL